MKKTLAILLCALMVLTVFAACGNPASSTPASSGAGSAAPPPEPSADGLIPSSYGGVSVTPAGELPIVKEAVTLTIMTEDHFNVSDYDDNKMTNFMEEQTGVSIEWILVPQTDTIQKVNLMLASQTDLPDVFMLPGTGITNDVVADYAGQGVFLPLDDMIETLGHWYKERREQDPLLEQIMKLPDGKEYSLPKVVLSEPNATSRRAWINQNWLDALELDTPTTTDELTEVLRAFKTQDPNGNGQNDEVGLMGSKNGWATNVEEYIMNSFLKYDRSSPWYLDNGTFTTALDKEAYRDGLKYMNMLASEGLLDTASFTQEDDQLKQLFANEEVSLVGLATGGGTFLWAPMDGERVREYAPLAPLKGPDGVQYSYYNPFGSYNVREFIITKACANPEVAFRFADYMYSREVSMRNRLGEPEVDYEIPSGGEMGVDGQPASYIPILAWGSVNNSHWNEIGPTYNDFDNNGVKGDDPYELQQYLWNTTINYYQPYLPPVEMCHNGNMFFDPEDARQMSEVWNTLKDHSQSALAEFVTGVRDPNSDADWDTYIDEITSIGYLDYIEIVQKRYDSMG